jgi:hypothetical protein
MCNNCYRSKLDNNNINCDCICDVTIERGADLFFIYKYCEKCGHFLKAKYYES